MTYSIIGRDRRTGEIGAAVQSKFPGVGTIVLHGKAGAGCLTTQAFSNPAHGQAGLDLMELGASPKEALAILLRGDEDIDQRQVALLNLNGEPAAHTGETVISWEGFAGSKIGCDCVVSGNALAGEEVLLAMVEAFTAEEGELAARLIAALQAGQSAGGELRGQQSASVIVVKSDGGYGGVAGRHVDISVYDHATPIDELARCYQLHRLSYFKSDPNDLLPISGALALELKEILTRKGYAVSEADGWNSLDIAALERFMGMENYDNRLRSDAQIDAEVLEDIRAKHGAIAHDG
ncbi:MAG: DUF1028 domain-containing protein [Rhodobacteraceae bacterium]|nr:DUF1028 domain-containing protein [Paracoccaceae bacterium]